METKTMVDLKEGTYTPESLKAILNDLEERKAEASKFPATGFAIPVRMAILTDIANDIEKVRQKIAERNAAN